MKCVKRFYDEYSQGKRYLGFSVGKNYSIATVVSTGKFRGRSEHNIWVINNNNMMVKFSTMKYINGKTYRHDGYPRPAHPFIGEYFSDWQSELRRYIIINDVMSS